MDKRRSIPNASVSILSRIPLLIAALILRRMLVRHIGRDANVMNATYTSVTGVLPVEELSVGSVIT